MLPRTNEPAPSLPVELAVANAVGVTLGTPATLPAGPPDEISSRLKPKPAKKFFGKSFHLGPPQRLAALLLLIFLGECLYLISTQQLSPTDYRYARCGREMWEKPSPLAGYFTTCGNLNGDGTFGYRLAGLPLTVERLTLQATDVFRKPEDRLYGGVLAGSTWENRHQFVDIKYVLHLPFVLMAIWLGGGLWWVTRRLFGNKGGFFALALYIFSPAILHASVTPNNDVLAMWGLYGIVFTAIGVAHALQGPRRKWRPRIALLVVAFGLTAAAHLLAAMLGFVAAIGFMLYLAERRRSYVMQILVWSAVGALVMLFAAYGFRPQPFTYVFTGGSARFWFSLEAPRAFFTTLAEAPIAIASLLAAILYIGVKRSRYFGNTTPLLVLLALAPVTTTQTVMEPWLWALPFLFTFLTGVFSDTWETRYRRMYLALAGMVLVAQATFCLASLSTLAQ